jgi:protein SCO1/2
VTAVQLMFTRCKALCPIQGALFAGVQKLLLPLPAELQLLSLSIDVKRDTPETVEAWLQRVGARRERWTGAVLTPADLDAMFDLVRGRKDGPDPHTAQAYVFNRRAELAYRTAELPVAASVVEVLQRVAELG